MKLHLGFAFLGFATLSAAGTAFADGDCRLAKPVPFTGQIGSALQPMVLRAVTLDQAPSFDERSPFIPGKDALELKIFVDSDGTIPGGIVARLESPKTGDALGFSDVCIGCGISYDQVTEGDEIVAVARHVVEVVADPDYADRHVPGLAITETRIRMRESDQTITGIEIVDPIYRRVKVEPHLYLPGFTGKNQALCVTSAQ